MSKSNSHRISCNDLTNMRGWETLESMLTERTEFATVATDNDRIYIVGRDYCDVFDIHSRHWYALSLPGSGASLDLGAKRPLVVTTGGCLYVFGNRPISGSNVFLKLDATTEKWTTLPSLSLRSAVFNIFIQFITQPIGIYILYPQTRRDRSIHS